MIRELLLLQSSDWGFIITNKTVAPYAWARIARTCIAFGTSVT